MVVRTDHTFTNHPQSTVCCLCRTYERADELCGEYEQIFKDRGFTDLTFHVEGNIFYDQ